MISHHPHTAVIRSVPALAAALALALAAPPAAGQAVRISGATTVRYLQLRPLTVDSVPIASAQGTGVLRQTADGRWVQCVDGQAYCYAYGSGARVGSAPGLQDLRISAWGFGRGLRVYAHLRGRAVVAGNTSLWPLASDHFDAMEAYVELERPRFRVRAGRQWEVNGLGFGSFDGGSLLVRPLRELNVEAYGGWSLPTGLYEPVTSSAISAVEPFAPEVRGVIFGVQAHARPLPELSLGAVYERRLAQDGSGLYSERVSTDGMLRNGRFALDWALRADLATRQLNELRGRLLYTLNPRLALRAFARRHRPYFDLWTIWGAFGAVGFTEGGVGASWRTAGGALQLDGQAARRHYLDTGAGVSFAPLRADGWSLSASGALRAGPLWTVDAQYSLDLGFGADKSAGGLRIGHAPVHGLSLGLDASAFQMTDELRVSEGTVVGLGLDGGYRLGGRSRIDGSVTGYRHLGATPDNGPDWSQLRANLTFSWTVGPEPGLPAPGGTP